MSSVIIVMPAFNAESTLKKTIDNVSVPHEDIILCDDNSTDRTVAVARELDITVLEHERNAGYGANQKTLYTAALERDPDVVIMIHPDNQYQTDQMKQGIGQITSGSVDYVIGSRVASARADGMPQWRWLGNRFLTAVQNRAFGSSLSELHSGLRLYRASMLRAMPYGDFSDDFVFDSETIAWAQQNNYRFGEIQAHCYYGGHESSVNFRRSVIYGLATLKVLIDYRRGKYRSSKS